MLKLPTMNPEVVANEIQTFILNKVKQHSKTGIVIGLSGGVDSAVVAALAVRAFKNTEYTVEGYYIPHLKDWHKQSDYKDVRLFSEKFQISCYTVDISNHCINLGRDVVHPWKCLNQFDLGNMCSRMRANVLWTTAAIENKLVCGTGNQDEADIGYYTMTGDGAAHIQPIVGLPKRLVYQLAVYLKIPSTIIAKAPSAGLTEGQTDQGELGYNWDIVETVMLNLSLDPEVLANTLIQEHILYYDDVIFDSFLDVIEDIKRRHEVSISKAEVIHPPSPNITLNYGD